MNTATPPVPPRRPDEMTASPPADDDVRWFGASRRLIGGVPDSRYGWLERPEGPCIVKAMDPALVAYNRTLLDHERRMLDRLSSLGAPVPAVVDVGRRDWLVTRFAGLSLLRLAQPEGLPMAVDRPGPSGDPALSRAERLSTWVHLLRRLQRMADAGVLAVDLYEANVLLPLTGGSAGQLRLTEAMLIDHAHTLEAGMDLRRPVWLDRHAAYIAPELRQALMQDQECLIAAFRRVGAELPGHSRLPGDRDEASRRAWAEYDAPQALQRLLDSGDLRRDSAMQFAAATALLASSGPRTDVSSLPALGPVLSRMRAEDPARRYTTLTEAAEALARCVEALPLVSGRRLGPVGPDELARPVRADEPRAASTCVGTGRAAELSEAFDLPGPVDLPVEAATAGALRRGDAVGPPTWAWPGWAPWVAALVAALAGLWP